MRLYIFKDNPARDNKRIIECPLIYETEKINLVDSYKMKYIKVKDIDSVSDISLGFMKNNNNKTLGRKGKHVRIHENG